MDQPYRLTTLPNGTRIASIEMPYMRSVSVGLWAGVGGRHENRRNSGISHFIEHLLFKGTKTRTAREIIESVEGVGGYLNAFTTEDHTCYYAKASARHLPKLCDVLADMYLNSVFQDEDIERERDVIREEILMYRDHPAQHAQELLSETMWPEHPLGRPLTGSIETISRFDKVELERFVAENYNGRTTIVTVAGQATHEEVLAAMVPALERLPRGRNPRFSRCHVAPDQPRFSFATQETEQTQLAMGFYAFGRDDDRRFALKLVSVILGENMSSRLFQKLREDHGFCYSISSGMVTLAEAGVLNIYAGLDTAKFEQAVKLIFRELGRLCQRAPSRAELRKAQDYTIGQTLMGLESTTNQMMWMGESILGYNCVLNASEIERRILAVQPAEVRAVACHCLNRARLGMAVVGPLADMDRVRGWVG